MKTISTRFMAAILALVLVSVVLSGCYRWTGPVWLLVVESTDIDPDFPPRYGSCEGSLTGSVVAGRLVNLTVTSRPGDPYTFAEARHEGRLRVGSPVVIEATCLDSQGEELGYARVAGRVAPPAYGGDGGSTHIYPAPELDEGRRMLRAGGITRYGTVHLLVHDPHRAIDGSNKKTIQAIVSG